jgi:7-carboxy-7-deazaguanine synthase
MGCGSVTVTYFVKEIYYSLQGEGANSGRAAVFCRFAGCNLWSGIEKDRATAICRFCDTDFVGTDGSHGAGYGTALDLARAVAAQWPRSPICESYPMVVCTGGEPLLQLDTGLVSCLHEHGFEVAIETNGTIEPPGNVDWICVSPKARTDLVVKKGDELKLVYPQPGLEPSEFSGLEFRHFFLQPMSGSEGGLNTRLAAEYCLKHPLWRLSLQIHLYLGIR